MRLEKLGRYEILGELGRGAMGVVFKARDPVIGRVVAIKTMGSGLSPVEFEAFEKRFEREARSAGRLNHANIVTIYDVGKTGDVAYIAMEFLEGRSLREILDSGVVMPPATVALIAAQIADGLAFAHMNDVVHRDIKPANIMVLDSGLVKIMDFGIAKLPTGSHTIAGPILGSPKYMSPERIVGRNVDARSDIFSLGAVLYEMLTGVPPFTGSELDEILHQVINAKPVPPSTRDRKIPAAFDRIVERSLAKHPNDRYETVREMATELRKLSQQDAPGSAGASPGTGARNAKAGPGDDTVLIGAPAQRANGSNRIDDDTVEVGTHLPETLPHITTAQLLEGSDEPRSWLRHPALILGVSAVLLALVGGWLLLGHDPANADRAERRASASSSGAARDAAPAVIPVMPASAAEPARDALAALASQRSPAIDRVAGSDKPAPPTAESARSAAVKFERPPNSAADPTTLAAATPGAEPVAPPKPTGHVALAVSPWGEVYVDGRRRGVSPPLGELRLSPGRHTIEIRNSTFAPHSETVDVVAGGKLRIKHKFQ